MRKWTGILLATLLITAAIQGFTQGASQPFTDVPANHWAANAIQALAERGIIEGVGGVPVARFDGRRPITRYEVAMALARMLEVINRLPAQQGASIEQIRNLILTDAQVREALRGATGATGAQGAPGTGVTAEQLRTMITNDAELQRLLRGASGTPGAAGVSPTPEAVAAALANNQQFINSVRPTTPAGQQFTPQEMNDIRRLLTTFGPTIAEMRGDVRALADRVTNVEKAVANIPPLRVSVNGGLRFGNYGTELGIRASDLVDSNADLAAMFGSPYTDLKKDSLHGSRFGVYHADINIDGAINDNVAAHATMRVVTPLAFESTPFSGVETPIGYDGLINYGTGAYGDNIQLWDWYATFNTSMMGRDVAATVGRHSTAIAEGLLVDTNRQPLVGVSLDSGSKPFTYGVNLSLVDRALIGVDPRIPQDFMGYAYLGWGNEDWNVVGTLMPRGFDGQRGWSVGAEGKLAGVRVFGELGHLIPAGEHFFSGFFEDFRENSAAVVGADLLTDWNGLNLTARYGKLGENYNPALSTLYPYSLVNAYDIDWVDRPLFLSQFNVSDGAELDLRYVLGKDWALRGRFYTGIGDNNPTAADDTVWTLSLKKPIADGVSASVLYGQRNLSVGDIPGLTSGNNLQIGRAHV